MARCDTVDVAFSTPGTTPALILKVENLAAAPILSDAMLSMLAKEVRSRATAWWSETGILVASQRPSTGF